MCLFEQVESYFLLYSFCDESIQTDYWLLCLNVFLNTYDNRIALICGFDISLRKRLWVCTYRCFRQGTGDVAVIAIAV